MNACLLCGDVNRDVTTSLAEWREPIDRQRFTALPRCRDRKACRERVEAAGSVWEVVKGDTSD